MMALGREPEDEENKSDVIAQRSGLRTDKGALRGVSCTGKRKRVWPFYGLAEFENTPSCGERGEVISWGAHGIFFKSFAMLVDRQGYRKRPLCSLPINTLLVHHLGNTTANH